MKFYPAFGGSGTLNPPISITGTSASVVPFTLIGAAGQTADIFDIKNSSGTILFSVDASGNIVIAGSVTAVISEVLSGNLSLNGNLIVSGTSTFGGAQVINGTMTANNSVIVNGTTTVNGNLNGNGSTTLNATSVTSLVIPSFTSGSVPFISTGGLFKQNNSVFSWDNTNNRLTVGSGSSAFKLNVYSTASDDGILLTGPNTAQFITEFDMNNGNVYLEQVVLATTYTGSAGDAYINGRAGQFITATNGSFWACSTTIDMYTGGRLAANKCYSYNATQVGGAPTRSLTLGVGATTFALSSNVMIITGDSGANTIATMTAGITGAIVTLIFVDALVTITDSGSGGTANQFNLAGGFTSASGKTLTVVNNGTIWVELARSTN